jgi:REP element-mobilizing transposase RayT
LVFGFLKIGTFSAASAHGVPPSIAHGVPRVRLTPYGEIIKRRIDNVSTANPDVFVDRYVIMPNHIHLILVIAKDANVDDGTPDGGNGTPRAASPTKAVVAKTINALKGLVSKEAGFSIWQRTYHDHIIRDEPDYIRIAEYIENNPRTWRDDCFYVGGGA